MATKKTTTKKATTAKKSTTKKAVAKVKEVAEKVVKKATKKKAEKLEIRVISLENILDRMEVSNSERDTIKESFDAVAKEIAKIFVEEHKAKNGAVEIKTPLVDYRLSPTERSMNTSAFAPDSIVDLTYEVMMNRWNSRDDEDGCPCCDEDEDED